VHHGNGTENIVEGDERIRLYSSYQSNYYPFPDKDASKPNVIHTPLNHGADGTIFRTAVTPWLADIDAFAPQLILISAGFDAHAEDPLAQIRLVEDDYRWITQELVNLANKHCAGRIVSLLEGGYNLSALGRSVVAHVEALLQA
jgi:acetoin utilization deacetylase AcuC-like enzyme